MGTSAVLLLCILATCLVWTSHARTLEVNIEDEAPVGLHISVEARKLPGKCWACEWALNKVKKVIGANVTAQSLKAKLMTVCDEIGLLKSVCKKFVKTHLGELIEELTTTDNVKTICVNMGACKPKEGLDLLFDLDDEEPHIITKHAPANYLDE